MRPVGEKGIQVTRVADRTPDQGEDGHGFPPCCGGCEFLPEAIDCANRRGKGNP